MLVKRTYLNFKNFHMFKFCRKPFIQNFKPPNSESSSYLIKSLSICNGSFLHLVLKDLGHTCKQPSLNFEIFRFQIVFLSQKTHTIVKIDYFWLTLVEVKEIKVPVYQNIPHVFYLFL